MQESGRWIGRKTGLIVLFRLAQACAQCPRLRPLPVRTCSLNHKGSVRPSCPTQCVIQSGSNARSRCLKAVRTAGRLATVGLRAVAAGRPAARLVALRLCRGRRVAGRRPRCPRSRGSSGPAVAMANAVARSRSGLAASSETMVGARLSVKSPGAIPVSEKIIAMVNRRRRRRRWHDDGRRFSSCHWWLIQAPCTRPVFSVPLWLISSPTYAAPFAIGGH